VKRITDFTKAATEGRAISMVSCYDATAAAFLLDSPVDAILIGDSGAMMQAGLPDTVRANLEMMCFFTASVARGCRGKKVMVADLPFLSFRKGLEPAVDAVQQLMQAGAHAVKLEGAQGNLDLIQHLVESGVPVMGHLGLTPQFVHLFGGYKIQGREAAAAETILRDAKALEKAGCFSLVLECVPADLARQITEALTIPTIGIGSGSGTSGQVLVWHDMLGLNRDFQPSFVRHFAELANPIQEGLKNFHQAVQSRDFPAKSETPA